MFQIKICGITNPEDALLAREARADAIGLNFYPNSKRYVSRKQARSVLQAVGNQCTVVGVFVNATAQEIRDIADDLQLAWVQLHGDEPPELPVQLPAQVSLIRAYRLHANGAHSVLADLELCQAAGRLPTAILVDAFSDTDYGGTGQTADWRAAASLPEQIAARGLPPLPCILAGGLTPANVAQAVAATRFSAVDVASGVESAPRTKDADLVRQFVNAARRAFASGPEASAAGE